MSAKLELSPRAGEDLAEILVGLRDKAGMAVADRWRSKFIDAFNRLELWPMSGPARADLGEGRRISVVRPYVIVYRADDEVVLVIRILHGSRDLPRVLDEPN